MFCIEGPFDTDLDLLAQGTSKRVSWSLSVWKWCELAKGSGNSPFRGGLPVAV